MNERDALRFAKSIEIELDEAMDQLAYEQIGQVLCWPAQSDSARGYGVRAVRRLELAPDEATMFEKFVRDLAYLVALHGEPRAADGWYRRESDDGWQVTCRAVWFGTGPAPSRNG